MIMNVCGIALLSFVSFADVEQTLFNIARTGTQASHRNLKECFKAFLEAFRRPPPFRPAGQLEGQPCQLRSKCSDLYYYNPYCSWVLSCMSVQADDHKVVFGQDRLALKRLSHGCPELTPSASHLSPHAIVSRILHMHLQVRCLFPSLVTSVTDNEKAVHSTFWGGMQGSLPTSENPLESSHGSHGSSTITCPCGLYSLFVRL